MVEGNTLGRVSASARTTRRGQRPWHVQTLLAREPGASHVEHCAGSARRQAGAAAPANRAEICIGVKEFMCIGESPPQDHPDVYINMGEANTILCLYCATRFRFDAIDTARCRPAGQFLC
jgi:uncharacterized Zn-finger protein